MKLVCTCGKSYWPKQAWLHTACVATSLAKPRSYAKPVGKTVAKDRRAKVKPPILDDKTSVQVTRAHAVKTVSHEGARVQKWREANRERYNKRMRDYRKARRLRSGEAPQG